MSNLSKQEKQVQDNFIAFKNMRPKLPKEFFGKFALMRDREIVEYFDSAGDARKYGELKFESNGLFSIQEVTYHIVDLGYYSHIVDLGYGSDVQVN